MLVRFGVFISFFLLFFVVMQQLINFSVKQTFGRAAAPPQRSQSLLPIITLLATSTVFFFIGHLFYRVFPLFSPRCSKKSIRSELSWAVLSIWTENKLFFFPSFFFFFFVKTSFILYNQLLCLFKTKKGKKTNIILQCFNLFSWASLPQAAHTPHEIGSVRSIRKETSLAAEKMHSSSPLLSRTLLFFKSMRILQLRNK